MALRNAWRVNSTVRFNLFPIKIIEKFLTERSLIDYSQEEDPLAKLQKVSMPDASESQHNVSMTVTPKGLQNFSMIYGPDALQNRLNQEATTATNEGKINCLCLAYMKHHFST